MMDKKFYKMSEEEKILYTVKAMNAVSFETAVTMEQIIGFAVKEGITEDYIRDNWNGYKEGDHPWWTKAAAMMGIGNPDKVMEVEEKHLHRQKVKKDTEGRKNNIMVYWYDRSKEHEVVRRNKKSAGKKKIAEEPEVEEKIVALNPREQAEKMEADPDKYRMINGKLISNAWIESHPDKFRELYGDVAE